MISSHVFFFNSIPAKTYFKELKVLKELVIDSLLKTDVLKKADLFNT